MENNDDEDGNSGIQRQVSITDTIRSIEQHLGDWVDALRRRAADPHDTDATNQALEAVIRIAIALHPGDLILERVYGPGGMPAEPADEEAAKRWSNEIMTTIVGRLLLPMFGTDFFPVRTLLADLKRWEGGAEGTVFGPLGKLHNPAAPDSIQRDDIAVLVLVIKMRAALNGKNEKDFVDALPPPAPRYRLFRKQQDGIPLRLRDWATGIGKRALETGDGVLIRHDEWNTLDPLQREALRVHEDEAVFRKLLAKAVGAGPYQSIDQRRGNAATQKRKNVARRSKPLK